MNPAPLVDHTPWRCISANDNFYPLLVIRPAAERCLKYVYEPVTSKFTLFYRGFYHEQRSHSMECFFSIRTTGRLHTVRQFVHRWRGAIEEVRRRYYTTTATHSTFSSLSSSRRSLRVLQHQGQRSFRRSGKTRWSGFSGTAFTGKLFGD